MNSRTRVTLLGVLAVAWFGLAVANFARAAIVVGLAYTACGMAVTVLALRSSRGRRSR